MCFCIAWSRPTAFWAVYTHGFLIACFNDPKLDCTALLAFNMIAADKLPQMPAQSYEDMMSGIRRILPS